MFSFIIRVYYSCELAGTKDGAVGWKYRLHKIRSIQFWIWPLFRNLFRVVSQGSFGGKSCFKICYVEEWLSYSTQKKSFFLLTLSSTSGIGTLAGSFVCGGSINFELRCCKVSESWQELSKMRINQRKLQNGQSTRHNQPVFLARWRLLHIDSPKKQMHFHFHTIWGNALLKVEQFKLKFDSFCPLSMSFFEHKKNVSRKIHLLIDFKMSLTEGNAKRLFCWNCCPWHLKLINSRETMKDKFDLAE